VILRALILGAALAGRLCAEDAAAQPLSPSAEAAAPQALSGTAEEPAIGHSGFLYAFSVSKWNVFNAGPLAYTPFEIGYDFGNGLRLQTAMDLFYYEGSDIDEKEPAQGVAKYTYEMSNWRSSVIYQVPLPIRLRPAIGISANIVGGSRKLARLQDSSGKDIYADKPKIPAWGYSGMGLQMGLEYLLGRDWTLSASLRYDLTFGVVPSPLVKQLGVAVTF
jgi:hypothetical protein